MTAPLTPEQRDLAAANRPLALHVAVRCRAGTLDLDDRLSAAYRGLLAAARAFDPGRGIKFSTYAVTAIKDQIAKAARDERLIHIPQHTYQLLRHGDRHPSPSPARRRQAGRCVEAARRLLEGHRLDAEWDLAAVLDDRPEPDEDSAARAAELLDRLGSPGSRDRTIVEGWMHDRSCRAMGRELGLTGEWVGRRLRAALEWLGAVWPPPGSRRAQARAS